MNKTVLLNLDSKGVNYAKSFSTFVDLLQCRANEHPSRVAYSFLKDGEVEQEKVSYLELDQCARKIAAYLQYKKLESERVLLIFQPGSEFVTAFMGCLYAGVVAVPVHPPHNQNLSRIRHIIVNAEARLVLTSSKLIEKFRIYSDKGEDISKLNLVVIEEINPLFVDEYKLPKIEKNSLAFLQYTSGSTGSPKGVMITHQNLLSNSEIIRECFTNDSESRGVIWLPPYHDMGLIGGILQPLYTGCTVFMMSPISFLLKPLRWLQAISNFRAKVSGGPNFAYDLCIRKINLSQCEELNLSGWEIAFTGAEPIRAETIELFTRKFEPYGFRKEAFFPCYGMAETTLMVTASTKLVMPITKKFQVSALVAGKAIEFSSDKKEQAIKEMVSSGVACPGVKIAIVNPETLVRCPDRIVGEIWISGSTVANGYWRSVKQTEESFKVPLKLTTDFFYRTGDLGFVDTGELFVTGRIKDVIIIRGRNHYPQDIEHTVEKTDMVALRSGSGAAFSLESQGYEQLFIVQELERGYVNKVNLSDVVDNILKEIAIHHGLEAFAVILVKAGSLPKTSSNKIQRYACKKGLQENTLNIIHQWYKVTPETAIVSFN